MTAPTLAQQIEAIEQARRLVAAMRDGSIDPPDDIEGTLDGLEAAAETLGTLDFARETLK